MLYFAGVGIQKEFSTDVFKVSHTFCLTWLRRGQFLNKSWKPPQPMEHEVEKLNSFTIRNEINSGFSFIGWQLLKVGSKSSGRASWLLITPSPSPNYVYSAPALLLQLWVQCIVCCDWSVARELDNDDEIHYILYIDSETQYFVPRYVIWGWCNWMWIIPSQEWLIFRL